MPPAVAASPANTSASNTGMQRGEVLPEVAAGSRTMLSSLVPQISGSTMHVLNAFRTLVVAASGPASLSLPITMSGPGSALNLGKAGEGTGARGCHDAKTNRSEISRE